ncbi:DUF1989 domain-containing protein [Gymnodinialimonas hymeniacidonis]|uniref:DUF1989 domain-containing protein n=1 Tax=Gymnodinialimonas hymeniacidonis TaxID=3126508 RepID=UPI0034C6C924
MDALPIHLIDNRGVTPDGRSFPGLAAPMAGQGSLVHPRQAVRFTLRTGDVLCIEGLTDAHAAFVCVLDDHGEGAAEALSLNPATGFLPSGFDRAEIDGWLLTHGLDPNGSLPLVALQGGSGALFLKTKSPVTLWVLNCLDRTLLTDGLLPDALRISVRSRPANSPLLPPPLGEVREEFTIHRGTAQAYELQAGEYLQVIDVEGQQCSDFMAFSAKALQAGQERLIDSTATRSMLRRAYPGPGLFDKFYDAEMAPLLNVVQDTCGRHDTFGMACTARGYEEAGYPGHLNCSDNISDALDPFGVARRKAWPAINFFWNTWIDAGTHQIQTEESWSRPGDYVTLRAIQPLVCVSTACPDDIDPINGWNPTDIHVRIYRPDAPIRRAVAYREKENAPVTLSQESAFHPATRKLTRDFHSARNLWVPNSFSTVGPIAEYWACRNAATLQDMSGLRKYEVVGPDAERLLQKAMTRDVAKLAVWRGTYALMCDAQGEVIDDGTLFRLADQRFRWCCGSEESARHLSALATEHRLQVRINASGDVLPNLALQGPKSRDILREFVFTQPHVPALDELKWFGVTMARVGDRDGIPFMLARSGYTGELGYELFCSASDAPKLWDIVMAAGEGHGLKPMGGAALETIRIEAGLAAAGAEFAPGVDALEAGLGFAVDFNKSEFVGKDALERNASAPRRVLRGLLIDGDDLVHHGAQVFAGERPVGVVTSATHSPTLERGIAMARLAIEHADPGVELEIGMLDGRMKRVGATVTTVPFIDPSRSRARA